ncbi:MAG: hypothetical protein R2879_08875 [Saprospiraceae bacterium]
MYDDKDDPKRKIISNDPTMDYEDMINKASSPDPPCSSINDFDFFILIINCPGLHFIHPRVGDTVTYVLKYTNKCQDTSGQVEIQFPANVDVIRIIDPFSDYPHSISSTNSLTINYSGLPTDEFQTMFITMKFLDDNPGTTLDFFITNKNFGRPCSNDTITYVLKAKGNSHDPNEITSKTEIICPNDPPDSIEYRLIFENIGDGPEDSVYIENSNSFLHEAKISKISRPGQAIIQTTQIIENGIIKWELKSKNKSLKCMNPPHILRGTKEDDLQDFSHTLDTVYFWLYRNKSIPLPNCGAIPIRAKIFFGENQPMYTNTFFSKIRCDSCKKCGMKENYYPELKINIGSDGNPVDLSLSNEYNYYWYPSNSLEDPFSLNPKFLNERNRPRYLIASKDCERVIYYINYFKKPEAPRPKIKWYYLFLIPFIVFGFYFFKKRSK